MIRFSTVLLVGAAIACTPGASAAGAGTLPPPVSGSWKVFSGASGHFVVTPHHAGVRNLVVTFGGGAPAGCSGTATVAGTHLIHHVTGTARTPIGTQQYNSWIVGKKGGAFARPETATIAVAGQSVTGGLAMNFTPRGGGFPKSLGKIRFQLPGQPRCEASFYFKKT